MQYLLFAWLVLLFFMSYYLTGKDFFAPSTMMVIGFIFSCALSIYVLSDLNYSLGLQTVWYIGSCMSISVLIGMIVHQVMRGGQIKSVYRKETSLSDGIVVAMLVFAAIIMFFQLQEIWRVGGVSGTFAQIMIRFRSNNAYSTDTSMKYPLWLRLALYLMNGFLAITLFNLLKFYKQVPVHSVILQFVFIAISCLSTLLTGARYSILTNLIAAIFFYHMIRIQRLGRYKTYKFGFLLRIIIIVTVAAWFFYWVKEMVGRVSKDGLLDYTAHYMGTGIINLDLFLKKPPTASNVWGKETFYSLINALRRLGIVDIDYYYVHKEFRAINGISMGNIYTALRNYLYDFGPLGMYALNGLHSLFFAVVYEYVKKSRSNKSILILGSMYYCNVLYFQTEHFYSEIISFGFAFRMITLVFLYILFIEKRVRIKIRKW